MNASLKRFRRFLTGYDVTTVPDVGWAGIKNGELLKRIERNFDIFITVDRNISFQQNPKTLPLPVIIIHSKSNKVKDLEPFLPELILLLNKKLSAEIYHIGA